MKNILVFLSLVSLAVPAAASKARVSALQGATFLIDTQTIFENPAHIMANGQLLTLEAGGTGSASNPKAEGGIFRKESEATYGVYLGHIDSSQTYRSVNGFMIQDNPVEAFYARDSWGASLAVSNADRKTTDEKESSIVGRFGMVKGDFEVFGSLQVLSTAKKGNDDFKGGLPNLQVGVEKDLGRFYLGGKLGYASIKQNVTGASADIKDTEVELSVLDRSLKTASRELYYGLLVDYSDAKHAGKKITSTHLPFVIGLETSATTWLTLRGSVKQNILLGTQKDETAGAPPADSADTIPNDTTVAVGSGIKFDNFAFDASIEGSTTGKVNGNQLLSNASLTYRF